MMNKNTCFRILVFDDHQEILDLLKAVLESRGGYEVLTYSHPGAYPFYDENENCSCPDGQACTDIILTDINMPVMRGIDFVEKQIDKGCQCRHLALMSGDYTSDEMQRASELGLKFFKKPFTIADVFEWLDQIEQNINPERLLTERKKLLR